MPFTVPRGILCGGRDRKIDEGKKVVFRGHGEFRIKSADNSLRVLPMQRKNPGYRHFLCKPLRTPALQSCVDTFRAARSIAICKCDSKIKLRLLPARGGGSDTRSQFGWQVKARASRARVGAKKTPSERLTRSIKSVLTAPSIT